MVSEDGQALLTFGITPLLHALFQPGANLESLGRAPNWVSPEELESGVFEKTPEADVWAFGMVALVCIVPWFEPLSCFRRNSLPANHRSTVSSPSQISNLGFCKDHLTVQAMKRHVTV